MTTSTPKVPTTPVMSHTVSTSAPHKMGPYNPAALISQTVAKKILDLNYVEMAEVALDDIPPATLRQNLSRLQVMDISRWTEKYAAMAALLCTRFPEKAPELFAYLQTITTAERNYDKGQWIQYDRLYRRQALARKDLDWSTIDTRLYQSIFTGRARPIQRCQHCGDEGHPGNICPEVPRQPWLGLPQYTPGQWNAPPYPQWQPAVTQQVTPPQAAYNQQVCRRFNKGNCKAGQRCKYIHTCLNCGGPHAQIQCRHVQSRQPGPVRMQPAPQQQSMYHR